MSSKGCYFESSSVFMDRFRTTVSIMWHTKMCFLKAAHESTPYWSRPWKREYDLRDTCMESIHEEKNQRTQKVWGSMRKAFVLWLHYYVSVSSVREKKGEGMHHKEHHSFWHRANETQCVHWLIRKPNLCQNVNYAKSIWNQCQITINDINLTLCVLIGRDFLCGRCGTKMPWITQENIHTHRQTHRHTRPRLCMCTIYS